MNRLAVAALLALSLIGAECQTNPQHPSDTPDAGPTPAADAGACSGVCDCACAVLDASHCREAARGRDKCRLSCEGDRAFWAKTPTPEKALPAECVAGAQSVEAIRACGDVCR